MYGQLKSQMQEEKKQQDKKMNSAQKLLDKERNWDAGADEARMQGIAQRVEEYSQQNAEIMFGNVKKMQDDTVFRYATDEQRIRLTELRARRAGLKGKALKRINAQIYEINSEVQKNVHKQLDEEVDNQLDAMISKEAVDKVLPIPYQDTVLRMKIQMSGDYGVDPDQRMGDIQALHDFEEKSERVRMTVARQALAEKRLSPKLSSHARKYLKARTKRVKEARNSLEEEMNVRQEMYDRSYHGVMPTEKMVERFHQRVHHYQEFQRGKGVDVSEEDAREALLERATKPITMEKLTETNGRLDQYKEAAHDQKRPVAQGFKAETIQNYQGQLQDVLVEMNKYLLHIGKPAITAEEAEEISKNFLKAVVEKGEFRFRCSGEVFGFIADDKMKTQMETNSSGGLNNVELRKNFSTTLFGQERGLLDNTEYENYGYLGSKSDMMDLMKSGTNQYGTVSVKLNKERMRDRTSCVVGDSLDTRKTTQPTPSAQPELACVNGTGKLELLKMAYEYSQLTEEQKAQYQYLDPELMLERLQANKYYRPGVDHLSYTDNSYFELQFHGDVTVRDMDEVTISLSKKYYPKRITEPDGKERYETKEEALRRTLEMQVSAIKNVVAKVEEINANPEKYGRKGMPPLKLNIVGTGIGNAASVIPKRYRSA